MPLEIQAQVLYDVLEAIFDYADTQLEPKGIGLMTIEKLKTIIHTAGVAVSFADILNAPAGVLTCQYRAMETQIHLLPPYTPGASPYDFHEADQPAVTKAGWIKGETIGLIIDGDDNVNYNFIQGCITHHDLRIKNSIPGAATAGTRYRPLPEKSTVHWYAVSLAPSVGVQVEGLSERVSRKFVELVKAQAMTQDRFVNEREALLSQERENQLSAMRNRMATNAILRASNNMDMLAEVGMGPGVRREWF